MSEITPKEIVKELNKHIIAQQDAKRAVAIALRNRWVAIAAWRVWRFAPRAAERAAKRA